jgi:hypothetical protein
MDKTFKSLFALFLGVFFLIPTITANSTNIAEDLTKLNNLYKEGAITQEEFSKAKDILFKLESNEEKKEVKKSETKKKEKKEVKKSETKKKEKKEVKKSETKKKEKKEVKIRNFEEDLTETYITLEEANALGTFKKIENVPEGMFKSTHKSFNARAKKSMMDMYDVFVRKKGLMEKYPENLMRAMGYFEFFYMDQLYKKRNKLKRFKEKYPNTGWYLANEIKSLYSLNEARKSMRKSMGLTLKEDPEVALVHYMTMYNFLSQGEKKINKLTKSEKKLKKKNAYFQKHYGSFKKTVQLKSEKRIDQETFDEDIKDNIKDVKSALEKLSKIDSKSNELYLSVSDMFEKSLEILEKCGANCERKNLLTVIDSINFTNAVLDDATKDLIKKRFTQDMSKVDVETLSDQEKQILASVSSNMKYQKSIKQEKLQGSVLNLENNDYPVDEFLDKIEEKGFEIKAISMSFENVDKMKRWAMKDWANSWRGDLPSELKDNAGNLIEFTEENIQDLKAQLAINTYNDILAEATIEIKELLNENVQEIAKIVENSGGFDLDAWLNQDFSITLDNYSRLVGNSYGIEMNDFKDLTKFVNEFYGTDVSPEEYAKVYESDADWTSRISGVDLINQAGSFDAAAIARQLGTDLQSVADSIAQAAAVGISTDLEAAAAGAGYASFADAVAAYNAQYGTNYTAEEAAKALGN